MFFAKKNSGGAFPACFCGPYRRSGWGGGGLAGAGRMAFFCVALIIFIWTMFGKLEFIQ